VIDWWRRKQMNKCNYLIPGFHHGITDEDRESECLLPYGHNGYHLNKLCEGGYISWGGDSCDEDCGWCGECFNYREISEAEALEILEDPNKNNSD